LELDRVFEDKLSGKDTKRPALKAMLTHVREGDMVVIHALDRLGRNLDDLRRLVSDLTGRGVRVQFIKESLTFTVEDSPMSTLLLNVMASFAEFERSLIRERQMEGIQLAKKQGVYKGRKPSLSAERAANLRKRVAAGNVNKADLAREFGISRAALYVYLASAPV
jgi:DNA invertase Pin-like site-specific DNA recombinase